MASGWTYEKEMLVMFYGGEFVVAHCEDVLQRKKIGVAQKEEENMGCHGGKKQDVKDEVRITVAPMIGIAPLTLSRGGFRFLVGGPGGAPVPGTYRVQWE